MNSFRDVISAMGGPSALARAIDGNVNTVVSWRQRNRIPPNQWAPIVAAAEESGVGGITYDALGRIAAESGRQNAA
jgi:hypothetical protein